MRYHKMKVCSESGLYLMESTVLSEADILTIANQLSRKRLSKGRSICSPQAVKNYYKTTSTKCLPYSCWMLSIRR
ncbi:hypothetical protein ACFOEM_08300 [Paenalcaligenes hominis]|uniref:hypothetical protein n=1 Tax=Paenalcaligenes hominis TaxID=643674 RepID=UPI00361E5179